jgi:NAD-dependent SIR2 family protein deacetylase
MDNRLKQFISDHERIFVLTGAGISTASGIPDYRDRQGAWKHQKPMQYSDFVASHGARQRYWTRSWFGWQRFSRARPNAAHHALARLEQLGRLSATVTQNVDGLQQLAGSRRVTELHGSLSTVSCLACGETATRAAMQEALSERNPWLPGLQGELAPDGDAEVHGVDAESLQVPSCSACGGVLKPDVVFFGESVPSLRVQQCRAALAGSDALLVVGSSLMVFSGFRFVREACQQGIPVAAINRGRTRADELLQHKFDVDCALALKQLLRELDPQFVISA